MYSESDVTAVICTWNMEDTIEECLISLKNNNIGSIILVDASSKDKTREIAIKYVNKILTDPLQGLAVARNIGIEQVNTKLVLNWGADNVMPKEFLKSFLINLSKEYAGISAQTYLKNTNNYFSKAMNIYKKARYFPGDRKVIGTPTLFETTLLQKNKYDSQMTHSDDGDLCMRLLKQGYKFKITNLYVYEIGFETISSIVERWKRYGKSDWETYSKYSKQWSISRKLKSLIYPFINEFKNPLFKVKLVEKFYIFPFVLLITIIRYLSWIKYSIKENFEN